MCHFMFPQQRDPVSPCHCQHLMLSLFFFILVILLGLQWYLIVVLIYVSVIANDVEYLFIMCFSMCAFFHLYMLFGELSAFKKASDLIWLLESRWIQIFLPSSARKAIIPGSNRLFSLEQSVRKPHPSSCLQAMNLVLVSEHFCSNYHGWKVPNYAWENPHWKHFLCVHPGIFDSSFHTTCIFVFP